MIAPVNTELVTVPFDIGHVIPTGKKIDVRQMDRHRSMHSFAGMPMAEVDQQGKAELGDPKTLTDRLGHGNDLRT